MRLWHKNLVPYLPRQQLISQWRECCCIARNIRKNGTPNHILVNKIVDYPTKHFIAYTFIVKKEMERRGYKCDESKFTRWFEEWDKFTIDQKVIFKGWHNKRYLRQCYFNLQEKYDNGGISQKEWDKVERMVLSELRSGVK